MPSAYAEK